MQKHERTVTYYVSALVLIKHDKKKEKKKKISLLELTKDNETY